MVKSARGLLPAALDTKPPKEEATEEAEDGEDDEVRSLDIELLLDTDDRLSDVLDNPIESCDTTAMGGAGPGPGPPAS